MGLRKTEEKPPLLKICVRLETFGQEIVEDWKFCFRLVHVDAR